MVQSIDNSGNRPNYNAVRINIKNPEVNVDDIRNNYSNDNGVYSAVNIEIDNPKVVSNPQKRIYDYPQAKELVTYDMANLNPVQMPQGFNLAYHTTNVILPNIENEIEPDDLLEFDADNIEAEEVEAIEVPEPNYTTLEEAKGSEDEENTDNIDMIFAATAYAIEDLENDDENIDDVSEEIPAEIEDVNVDDIETDFDKDIEIMNKEIGEIELKRPEIIKGEDILPDLDVPLLLDNLNSEDYDIQAEQIEEIARVSLSNKDDANKYLIKEVFSSLIEITKKDTSSLAAPSDEQIEARRKIISNFIAAQTSDGKESIPSYEITDKEIELANELSPMEMAERNKEYALYTISILAKVYSDEVEEQTGNIVPLTDLPGSAAMVDALRYNPNAGVKIAALDSLRHIQRPEYNEELTTLYALAQNDGNPQVALAAYRALNASNN